MVLLVELESKLFFSFLGLNQEAYYLRVCPLHERETLHFCKNLGFNCKIKEDFGDRVGDLQCSDFLHLS